MPQEQENEVSVLVVALSSATVFGLIFGAAMIGAAFVLRDGRPPSPNRDGLAELLPEEKRPVARQYFLDYAEVAKTGEIETVEEAYDVYSRSIQVLKNAKNWVGSEPAFDEAVSEHLERELGKSGPVDKDKLSSAFRGVGEELQ